MKQITIIALLLGLFSCTGYYHLKKANKHAIKAVQKGAVVKKDTTYLTISDTLTEVDTIDNYIRITQRIKDTVYIQGNTTYIAKSRTEVRQEQRTERKQIKQEQKTERAKEKQKTKQVKKAAKKRSLFAFLVSLFIIGMLLVLVFAIRGINKSHDDSW